MSETKKANPANPIHDLISRRWSPYSFDSRPVSEADLRSIFEAARWAASSFNEHPWSFILATSADPDEFEKLLSCLIEPNQVWARSAPVLALGVAGTRFRRNDKPNRVAIHDLGLAVGNLSLEATSRDLVVHQMAGILADRARTIYAVPQDHEVVTGIAIGYAGDPASLPEILQGRDRSPRARKPLNEFVFTRKWGADAGWGDDPANPDS